MVFLLAGESPFVFEGAVPPDKFFNRQEEIEFLVRNLRAKKKMLLCIVAPLKYGKTSLMRRYHEILSKYPDIISIYINLKKIKNPIMYILDNLREHKIDLIKKYEESIRREDLLPLFEELNNALSRENKWLFLLFDEFHPLPELIRSEGFYKGFTDEMIFGFLRGLAEDARISYIVCGSVIEPLMRALDVWGGRFQILYLGPFDEEEAVNMIKELFAMGGMRIDDEHARIIAEAAGFHPFYIQYMGHQIYISGRIDRGAIRLAKQKLFEYLIPIFITYLGKIRRMGKEYLDVLAKIICDEPLTVDDMVIAADLLRMGIIKPQNAKFEVVDPLFKRYLEQIIRKLRPTEVTVVGHWAERIVGNYLLRRGYIPYYSHDSKGVFDIYVRIQSIDVGIQVRYSSRGEIYLSQKEVEEILETANKLGWRPLIALVSRQIKFFSKIEPGKYSERGGYTEILDAVKNK